MDALERQTTSSTPNCSPHDGATATPEQSNLSLHVIKQSLTSVRDNASCNYEALLFEIDKLAKIVCQMEVHVEDSPNKTCYTGNVLDTSKLLCRNVSKALVLAASGDAAVHSLDARRTQSGVLIQPAKPQPQKPFNVTTGESEGYKMDVDNNSACLKPEPQIITDTNNMPKEPCSAELSYDAMVASEPRCVSTEAVRSSIDNGNFESRPSSSGGALCGRRPVDNYPNSRPRSSAFSQFSGVSSEQHSGRFKACKLTRTPTGSSLTEICGDSCVTFDAPEEDRCTQKNVLDVQHLGPETDSKLGSNNENSDSSKLKSDAPHGHRDTCDSNMDLQHVNACRGVAPSATTEQADPSPVGSCVSDDETESEQDEIKERLSNIRQRLRGRNHIKDLSALTTHDLFRAHVIGKHDESESPKSTSCWKQCAVSQLAFRRVPNLQATPSTSSSDESINDL